MFHNSGLVVIGCSLIISALIAYEGRKYSGRREKKKQDLIALERKANQTRRKDISGLDYIHIPIDELPFIITDNDDINSCQNELRRLSELKILNLSGISNTDLKLQYGVSNLETLSTCDANCTLLFKTLTNLGEHLSQNGFHEQAVAFLEYAVSLGCDISRCYYVLADEYASHNDKAKMDALLQKASTITSLLGPSIVAELEKKLVNFS